MKDSRTFAAIVSLPDDRSALRYLAGVRWGLLVAALLISIIGLLTIHSASSELDVDYFPRQLVRLLLLL